MYKNFSLVIIIIAVLLCACSANSSDNTKQANPERASHKDTALSPVETKSPNSKYKAAFKGQTRVAGVKTTTPFVHKILSKDLKSPWGIRPFQMADY